MSKVKIQTVKNRIILRQLGKRGLPGERGEDGAPGQKGPDGDSAYQAWLDLGNVGTEQDFIDSLKGADSTVPGPKGDKGDIGPEGPKGDTAIVFQDEEPAEKDILWADTDEEAHIVTSINGETGDLTGYTKDSALDAGLSSKVSLSGDTMTDTLGISRSDTADTTGLLLQGLQPGGRQDVKYLDENGNPLAKMSAHTNQDPSSNETHWQVYTYKGDLITAQSVFAIQSQTDRPIATFNNVEKLQVSSAAPNAASRLYLTKQNAATKAPDEANMMVLEKRGSSGSQLQDIASSGNALFDIDPVALDGVGSASVRFFRNVNTGGNKSLSVYRGNGSSDIQHNLNAYGNSYVNAMVGNFGIGTTMPSAPLDVNGDTIRLRTSKTPASATASGNAGDIAWDENYMYVCIATNTWKRSPLSTWA